MASLCAALWHRARHTGAAAAGPRGWPSGGSSPAVRRGRRSLRRRGFFPRPGQRRSAGLPAKAQAAGGCATRLAAAKTRWPSGAMVPAPGQSRANRPGRRPGLPGGRWVWRRLRRQCHPPCGQRRKWRQWAGAGGAGTAGMRPGSFRSGSRGAPPHQSQWAVARRLRRGGERGWDGRSHPGLSLDKLKGFS